MSDPESLPLSEDPLVQQLTALLRGGQAHVSFEAAVENFPPASRGVVPDKLPYSAWQLVEHLRLAQRDILDFCAPPPGGYKHLAWPAAYWPSEPAPPEVDSWDRSVEAIQTDLRAFEALLSRTGVDLFTPFAWGDGQNLLREALLIADHNSYHTGELLVLRRLLGAWPA